MLITLSSFTFSWCSMKWIIIDNQVIWLNEYGKVDIDIYVPFPEQKLDLVVSYLIPWSDTINRDEEEILGDVVYNKGDHKRVTFYLIANYLCERSKGKEYELDWKPFLMKVLCVDRLSWEMDKWYYHHKLKKYRNIFGDIVE